MHQKKKTKQNKTKQNKIISYSRVITTFSAALSYFFIFSSRKLPILFLHYIFISQAQRHTRTHSPHTPHTKHTLAHSQHMSGALLPIFKHPQSFSLPHHVYNFISSISPLRLLHVYFSVSLPLALIASI